jgi:hypothetical protein
MLDTALVASDFVTGMTFEQFREDRKTVDAVVGNLEVIAGAAGHISEDVRKRFPKIPWPDIVGTRSILIGDFAVEADIFGFVDLARPTGTNWRHDLIRAKSAAFGWWHASSPSQFTID